MALTAVRVQGACFRRRFDGRWEGEELRRITNNKNNNDGGIVGLWDCGGGAGEWVEYRVRMALNSRSQWGKVR